MKAILWYVPLNRKTNTTNFSLGWHITHLCKYESDQTQYNSCSLQIHCAADKPSV